MRSICCITDSLRAIGFLNFNTNAACIPTLFTLLAAANAAKEALETESNKSVVQEAVSKVAGSPLRIEFKVLEVSEDAIKEKAEKDERREKSKEEMKPVIEKAMDVFGPGRHTLSTLNVPLITAILTMPWEKSPFQSQVYFVGKQTFIEIKNCSLVEKGCALFPDAVRE